MISVIVPVYQAQEYLRTMIDSICFQTYQEWELLLIVSKSADDSLAICQEYEKKDTRIRVLDGNGLSAGEARNKGLEITNAEYILFVDADDFLPDSAVMDQFLKAAVQTDADITVSNYERLWDGQRLSARSHACFSSKDIQSEDFRFQGFFSVGTLSYVWGKLYRKAFLDKNNIRFHQVAYAEDKLFNIECYLEGARYVFVEQIEYVYRKNEQSISYRYNPHLMDCWIAIADIIRKHVKAQKEVPERIKYAAAGLIEYTLFFGIFFAAKMEYTVGKRSIAEVRRLVREYGKNPLVKKVFGRLSSDGRICRLSQLHWRIMLRIFSTAMNGHLYWTIAIGIKLLAALRIDERLSDTGLRRKKCK